MIKRNTRAVKRACRFDILRYVKRHFRLARKKHPLGGATSALRALQELGVEVLNVKRVRT